MPVCKRRRAMIGFVVETTCSHPAAGLAHPVPAPEATRAALAAIVA